MCSYTAIILGFSVTPSPTVTPSPIVTPSSVMMGGVNITAAVATPVVLLLVVISLVVVGAVCVGGVLYHKKKGLGC